MYFEPFAVLKIPIAEISKDKIQVSFFEISYLVFFTYINRGLADIHFRFCDRCQKKKYWLIQRKECFSLQSNNDSSEKMFNDSSIAK